MRKILALPLAASLVLALAVPAAAAPTKVIVLPGATSAEGITAGEGSTFYAGELFDGDIYRGDIRLGTAELFIDAPAGTEALGMDVRGNLLFVAGGEDGIRVHDTRTGATVATYGTGDTTLVNDVTVTPYGAWFTDSLQPRLYFVPVRHGVPGTLRTLALSGPAAGAPGVFHLNGITSTPAGATLLVAPQGKLCTIDPITGTSELVDGVEAPGADGLVLDGRRLWVVEAFTGQAFANRVSRWQLSADFGRGTADGVLTDPAFGVPVTAAKFGNRLAVMNSHLNTGYPPVSPTYEVVVVGA